MDTFLTGLNVVGFILILVFMVDPPRGAVEEQVCRGVQRNSKGGGRLSVEANIKKNTFF